MTKTWFLRSHSTAPSGVEQKKERNLAPLRRNVNGFECCEVRRVLIPVVLVGIDGQAASVRTTTDPTSQENEQKLRFCFSLAHVSDQHPGGGPENDRGCDLAS